MMSFTSMLLPVEVRVPQQEVELQSPAGSPGERNLALAALCVAVAAAFTAALWLA